MSHSIIQYQMIFFHHKHAFYLKVIGRLNSYIIKMHLHECKYVYRHNILLYHSYSKGHRKGVKIFFEIQKPWLTPLLFYFKETFSTSEVIHQYQFNNPILYSCSWRVNNGCLLIFRFKGEGCMGDLKLKTI